MKDLDFVSGRFKEFEVPKEKLYLLKYFKNDFQKSFLKYFMLFGDWHNFIDHTGLYCSERIQFKLARRYKVLIKAYDEAKARFDEEGMAMISLIESGNFVLTKESI